MCSPDEGILGLLGVPGFIRLVEAVANEEFSMNAVNGSCFKAFIVKVHDLRCVEMKMPVYIICEWFSLGFSVFLI